MILEVQSNHVRESVRDQSLMMMMNNNTRTMKKRSESINCDLSQFVIDWIDWID